MTVCFHPGQTGVLVATVAHPHTRWLWDIAIALWLLLLGKVGMDYYELVVSFFLFMEKYLFMIHFCYVSKREGGGRWDVMSCVSNFIFRFHLARICSTGIPSAVVCSLSLVPCNFSLFLTFWLYGGIQISVWSVLTQVLRFLQQWNWGLCSSGMTLYQLFQDDIMFSSFRVFGPRF
jgi:hypothetical protein